MSEPSPTPVAARVCSQVESLGCVPPVAGRACALDADRLGRSGAMLLPTPYTKESLVIGLWPAPRENRP